MRASGLLAASVTSWHWRFYLSRWRSLECVTVDAERLTRKPGIMMSQGPKKLNAGRPLAQGSGSCSESAAHCTPAPSGSESRAAGDRDRGLLRPDLVMFPRRRPGALRASEARASTPGPGRRFHPRHWHPA